MAYAVIARNEGREETFEHASATDAYEHAIQLFEGGSSYVAIRDEEGQDHSSSEFAARHLSPVGKPNVDHS